MKIDSPLPRFLLALLFVVGLIGHFAWKIPALLALFSFLIGWLARGKSK